MSVLISHVRLGKSVLKPVNNVHWNNLHKILKVNQNDTNLSCDKFFRQDELFDKTKDFLNSGYRHYSVDDVSLCYETETDRDINSYFAKRNPYVGSKAERVKLLKDGKIFYSEKLDAAYFSKNQNNTLLSFLDKGYSVNDIVNILYSSKINGVVRTEISDFAFKLLDKGYPIEKIVRYIEKSKLLRFNGTKKYTSGMLEFIEQFPHLKYTVVSKNSFGEDIFDKHGAKLFSKLYDVSPDEMTAIRAFRDCKVKDVDGSLITLDYLYEKVYEILKTKGKYTHKDTRVIAEMRKHPMSDEQYHIHKYLMNRGY